MDKKDKTQKTAKVKRDRKPLFGRAVKKDAQTGAKKRKHRQTTILARIVRLSSMTTAATAVILILLHQYSMYRHINDSAFEEIELLSLSYASAVSNADIYSNAGFLDGMFSDFRSINKYGGTGFIMSKTCTVMSETGIDLITKGDDLIDRGNNEPGFAQLANFVANVQPHYESSIDLIEHITVTQKDMQAIIEINGRKYYTSWANIKNYDNIYVMILIPYDNVMQQYRSSMVVMPLLGMGAVIVATILAVLIARRMTKPIEDASARMGELARGDLTSPAPETDRNDETMSLLRSLSLVITSFNAYINDIRQVLDGVAEGDLLVSPHADYRGDFVNIKESLERILSSLSSTFSEVQKAAISVNECSGHVSDGTAVLSRNSLGEASASEGLAKAVDEVTARIKSNADEASRAREMTAESDAYAAKGMENMRRMTEAISDIERTASEIETIIGVIDDIAFQTNILALNAAVEAARAGEAGRGFAVVADEVRNLAIKSAEASSKTRELIENSLRSVSNGTRYAKETEQSLDYVANMVGSTRRIVSEIADSADEQAVAISAINKGMTTINDSIRDNSLTAEQNAAVSEELSSQFNVLTAMLNRFRFRKH